MRSASVRLARGLGRNWGIAIAILLGAVLPAVIAGISGNLSIPHNDAWSYSRIAETFARTGRLNLLGWSRSALIGQIIVLGPLAKSLVAQQLSVAVFAVMSLLSVYGLLMPRVGRLRAGIVALACALWPGFALLATSYMTDVPALATSFLALYLADRAFRRDSRLLFWAAMLVAFWSCTIRLQDVAAPAAILLYALATRRRRTRVGIGSAILAGIVFAVVFGSFTLWQRSLPDGLAPVFAPRSDWLESLAVGLARTWFGIAIAGAPLAAFFARPWRWRRLSWVASGIALLAGGALLIAFGRYFFLPNYLSQSGAYGSVLPQARVLYSWPVWHGIIFFAIAGGALLAGMVVENRTGSGALVSLFSVITLLGVVQQLTSGQPVLDRYTIGLLPWIVCAALPRRVVVFTLPERTIVLAVASLMSLALLATSGGVALSAWAFDRARWTVGSEEVAAGTPADRVDAGFEWLGWHSARGAVLHSSGGGWGSELMFDPQPACVVLTGTGAGPAKAHLMRTVEYRTFLLFGESALWVWQTGAAGCP